jgi:hypothetical protein
MNVRDSDELRWVVAIHWTPPLEVVQQMGRKPSEKLLRVGQGQQVGRHRGWEMARLISAVAAAVAASAEDVFGMGQL